MIWLQGWSAVLTQSHRQSSIRTIRYACIAVGYSRGLETSIISQQLEYETTVNWVYMCVSQSTLGPAIQQRLSKTSFSNPPVLSKIDINCHYTCSTASPKSNPLKNLVPWVLFFFAGLEDDLLSFMRRQRNMHPNFSHHHVNSQFVTDSCSPSPTPPTACPSLHPSLCCPEASRREPG